MAGSGQGTSFLTDAEIERIQADIPQALADALHLIAAEDGSGELAAFMGIDGRRLEMLFVAPEWRGHGLGKKLLECGIKDYSVNELGVNEQNPQARGFYEHMGFQVYKRTPTDEQGMPSPILSMKLP
ncbi:MAG: GNAT family N-acetyltransferase [Oscillospiraceae bacterium]